MPAHHQPLSFSLSTFVLNTNTFASHSLDFLSKKIKLHKRNPDDFFFKFFLVETSFLRSFLLKKIN